MIGLWSSSASCSFCLVLFSIPLTLADLSEIKLLKEKAYKPQKQDYFHILNILGFSNIKCFIT